MATEAIRPLGQFYGTTLASRVSGYDRLMDRITWSLGYPMVNVELHKNQIYENITIAVEFFTKYAGYTKEFLIFDTKYYEKGKGLRLDKLFSITRDLSGLYASQNLSISNVNPLSLTTYVTAGSGVQDVYTYNVSDTDIDPSEFNIRMIDQTTGHQSVRKILVVTTHNASLSTTDGNFSEYNIVYTSSGDIGSVQLGLSGAKEEVLQIQIDPLSANIGAGTEVKVIVVPVDTTLTQTAALAVSAVAFGAYDKFLNQYRKVMSVVDFNEGSTTGVNTLFTIEQTLAQQTYFSYTMGQYGFDLVSWHVVKEWLDVREKILSIKQQYEFNPHTQYLRLYPEPDITNLRMYGVVSCYLEQPIEYIIHEQWIYQYALALCKITLGRIRGKYGSTALFGGGQLDTSLLQEGLTEKKELEELMLTGTPGFGDADPPMFFIG